jgi:hypothetical protein
MTNAFIIGGMLGAYAIIGVWVLIEVGNYLGKDANDGRPKDSF